MSPAEMRRRYEAGESSRKIGAAAGVSEWSVRRRLRMVGAEVRLKRGDRVRLAAFMADRDAVLTYLDGGRSCQAAAYRWGVSLATVRRYSSAWRLERASAPQAAVTADGSASHSPENDDPAAPCRTCRRREEGV